jgi:intein/homing endonuclease
MATQWLSTLDNRTCLVGETLLQTPSGFQPIDAIRIGDMVIGGSGQERRVLATPRSQTTALMKVTLDNGQTIVCTPDHRFLVEIDGKQVWRDAVNLFNGDEIASIMKVLAG